MLSDEIVKMLFQVTVCVLLCRAGLSSARSEEFYQLGNAQQLESSEAEILPEFNEYSPAFAPLNEYQPIDEVLSQKNAIIANHNRMKRGIRSLRKAGKGGGSRGGGGGSRGGGGGGSRGGGGSSRGGGSSHQTASRTSYGSSSSHYKPSSSYSAPHYTHSYTPSLSSSRPHSSSAPAYSSSSRPLYSSSSSANPGTIGWNIPPHSSSPIKTHPSSGVNPNNIGWGTTPPLSSGIRPTGSMANQNNAAWPGYSNSIRPTASSSMYRPHTTIINNNNYNNWGSGYNTGYYPGYSPGFYPGYYPGFYSGPGIIHTHGGGSYHRSNSRITFSPENDGYIYVKEDKDFDITCEGAFYSLAWYRDNIEVSTDKKKDVYQKSPETKYGTIKRKLKFDDVDKRHSGRYTCTGISTYDRSRVERSFLLTVKDGSFFSSGLSGVGKLIGPGLAVGAGTVLAAGLLGAAATSWNPDDPIDEPRLTIDDDTIRGINVYSKVNDSLEVICKGDTEDIAWRSPPHGFKITENSTFSSHPARSERVRKTRLALRIKSVALTDEGEYTCEVTEKAKTKKKSFQLKVIEPVHIIDFSQNSTSPEGGQVTLECKTTGHPKPIVNWRFNEIRPDGTSHSKLIDDRTNPRYKFKGNSLVITNITYQEAGRYMCEAKQDIEKGTTDMKTVDVFVQHKPYPLKNFTVYEKALDLIAEIPCKMSSNPPANYTWYRKINGTYENISLPTPDSVFKMNMTNESFGEYKCRANNSLGYDDQYILINKMEFPQPPKIELVNVTNSAVYFRAEAEKNISFTHYLVEYQKNNTLDWYNVTIPLGETWDMKYNMSNLTERTNYTLRVRSVNDLGISIPSNVIEFTTKELPTPPRIELEKITDSLIDFKAINAKNSTLTQYNVEYKPKFAKNWASFNITPGSTWDHEYELANLSEKTIYVLRLRSINEMGLSDPSEEIEFTTASRQSAKLKTSFGVRMTASYSLSFSILAFSIVKSLLLA